MAIAKAFRPDGTMVTGSAARAAIASGQASPVQPASTRTNQQSATAALRNEAAGFGSIKTDPATMRSTYTSKQAVKDNKPFTIQYSAQGPVQTPATVGTQSNVATKVTPNNAESVQQVATPTTTMSSEDYAGGLLDIQKEMQDYEKRELDEQERRALKIKKEQDEQQKIIEERYGIKKQNLLNEQEQELASQNALAFRLQRKDTVFGQEELAQMKQIQQTNLLELDNQMSDEISKMRAAIAKEDMDEYDKAKDAYDKAFNQKIQLNQEYRAQRTEQLKAIQDAKSAELEKKKFDFDVYKFQQEQMAAQKPLVVSAGSSIYDPSTMEYLGTAPEPADVGAPEIEKWGGMVHQWNPITGGWETLGSEKEIGDIDNGHASAANLISSGKAKLTDYPPEDRGAISTILDRMPPKTENVEAITKKIDMLGSLLNDPGITKAVGPNALSRANFNPFDWNDKSQRNAFVGTVQQLLSDEVLNKLISAKADGATFGALSEGELLILQNAVSKIGNWARDSDGDGRVDYYEVGEKEFKKEIERIKNDYETLLKKNTAGLAPTSTPQKKLDEYYINNPAKRDQIDQLETLTNPYTNKPYTDEEKIQILGISFNNVGGDTQTATKIAAIPDNTKGGQCGRFVNQLTGLGVGDSYDSKMKKMDPTIKEPAPGMVFVMPYKDTGHIGFIVDVKDGIATVKDSNYGLDEKIRTHQIPVSRMTGFRKVNLS